MMVNLMSSVSQLQQAMAALRLSLANIRHKEEQLDAQIAQFRTQLRRLPRQAIYGRASLEMALAAMGEIEERLQDAEQNRRRVRAIKKAALDELAALESVQQVADARKTLAQLKQQNGRQLPADSGCDSADTAAAGDADAVAAEIRRLEQFIAQHSRRAEQTITANFEERRQQD